jgi:hypothetical protein
LKPEAAAETFVRFNTCIGDRAVEMLAPRPNAPEPQTQSVRSCRTNREHELAEPAPMEMALKPGVPFTSSESGLSPNRFDALTT